MTDKNALWQKGHDQEVQVNQRALIDKVLARYSGEFTVFRELLQNSDDADATNAEIHFNTQAYKDRVKSGTPKQHLKEGSSNYALQNLKTRPLAQWIFRNDGMPFRDQDWDRLKKIAKGNPDEKKIGAFGVGFYSLFSITDEPFVKSEKQWMGFYWKNKGDQLFTRRGELASPPELSPSGKPWTSFEMPLRQPSPLPGLLIDLARFLATSVTFMVNLRDVSVFVDGLRLIQIQKDIGPINPLSLPNDLNPTSTLNTMVVKTLNSQEISISAHLSRYVYYHSIEKSTGRSKRGPTSFKDLLSPVFTQFASTSRPLTPTEEPQDWTNDEADPLEVLHSSVNLHIYSAGVDVTLEENMISELERATKKKPPSTCSYSLIYSGKNEYTMNRQEEDVFRGLRADVNGSGTARVFIGHATSQSTGIGGHVSARFIPTVERESIDLVNPNVSLWNKELLYIGGFLARFVYDMQMLKIRDSWEQTIGSADSNELVDHVIPPLLEDQSIHTMRYFSFHATTPSSLVGSEMEAGFFSCAPGGSILILSTNGVRPAGQVRFYNRKIQVFMKKLPMLSSNMSGRASTMVKVLLNRGILKHVSMDDVLCGLDGYALSEDDMVKCLEWWTTLDGARVPQSDQQLGLADFLKVASFKLSPSNDGQAEQVVSLASIKFFVSSTNPIPPSSPLPPQTLPPSISKNFQINVLQSTLGWGDLGVVDWIEYLVSPSTVDSLPRDENITRSDVFAEKVLNIVAKTWSILPEDRKRKLIELLDDKAVIPTRKGLKRPKESYFSQGNLFRDLPIVNMPNRTPITGHLEKLLEYLGVMKHVEMRIVIERMIDTGSWDTSDLMTYLVKHRQSLPAMEFANLRRRRVFPMEQAPGAHPYKTVLSELYEPLDVFRQLKLPILDWGENRWQPHTEEARMLVELGLKTHPDLQTIMNIMVDSDENIRKQGLVFFLNNFDARYASGYRIGNVRHLAFIPAIKSNGDHFMAKPDDVYADPECAVMGFPVVEPQFCDVAELKLRVSKHPPVTAIMKILLGTPPTTPEIAQGYFEYLAMRVADFSTKDLDVLRDASIIPTSSQKDDSNSGEDVTWVMVKPRECILETEAKTTLSNLHSKIFVSIDFGSKGNIFLKACGVKDQPDIEDIVPIILQDPKKFLNVVGGPKGYQEQLRQIAAYKNFPPRLMSQMRSSPFLFGQRRSMRPTSQSPSDVKDKNESQYDLLFDLLKPNEIAIVDDTNSYLLFASSLYVAPQEDLLETFYSNLGSPRLTTLIKDSCDADHIEGSETDMASKVRNLVLERLPLLLLEPNMQARVSPAWLAVNDNFQVRVYQKLRLKRILSFHRHISIRSQDVTANAVLATWCGQIRLILLLKMGCEPDMYEMANSVCKALLINSRPKDSLLFTTMLSTDLEALRRRGYDVDRILNQQKLKIAEEIRQAEIARQKSQKPDSQSPSPAPNPSKPSKALENIWRNAMSTRGKSYCDVRGSEEYTEPKQVDFGYQLFVSRAISHPDTLTSSKRGVIERFTSVVLDPLKVVFNLPATSLNIIYDPCMVLVSFNRGGNLFLNIKRYEEWHDAEVCKGSKKKALTSWYHTIAHQIAHNAARSHNATHQYYFSALCEHHLADLVNLMKNQ